MLTLDFRKAFDSINRKFMLHTLRALNFGPEFTNWITTMNSNTECIIIVNNGWSSAPFAMTNGIRQGCPISVLIFILTVEVLANAVIYDKEYLGIKLPIVDDIIEEARISQLADDTVLFVGNENSIYRAFEIIEDFCKVSNLHLNFF